VSSSFFFSKIMICLLIVIVVLYQFLIDVEAQVAVVPLYRAISSVTQILLKAESSLQRDELGWAVAFASKPWQFVTLTDKLIQTSDEKHLVRFSLGFAHAGTLVLTKFRLLYTVQQPCDIENTFDAMPGVGWHSIVPTNVSTNVVLFGGGFTWDSDGFITYSNPTLLKQTYTIWASIDRRDGQAISGFKLAVESGFCCCCCWEMTLSINFNLVFVLVLYRFGVWH
jgi:hypothetical protein